MPTSKSAPAARVSGRRAPASRPHRRREGAAELPALLHELRVHQAALAQQNEEVRALRRELLACRQQHVELYELAPVAYLMLDTSFAVVGANLAASTLLGVPRSQLLRARLARYVPPAARRPLAAHCQEVLAGDEKKTLEIPLRRADGTTLRIHIESVAGGTGSARQLHLALSDVTERLRGAEALLDGQARLRAILDTALEAILTVDETGLVDSFNRGAERMFGYSAGEMLGKNVRLLVPPSDRDRADLFVARPMHNGQPRIMGTPGSEVMGRRRDGRTFPIELTVVELTHGRALFTVIIRDLTERTRLEAELRRAQKMEAIGRLTSAIAHDFNNLLMGITGCADMALGRLPANAEARGFIADLKSAALRGASLTGQLLTLGRRDELAPTVVGVSEVVRRSEGMLRGLAGEGVELRLRLAPEGASVRLDPGELEQVLTNLVMNARHATAQTGHIDVEIANVELSADDDGPSHPALPPGPYVRLTVRDDGCGMDEGTRSRAFEPFFTTKEPGAGTGLGLATVYGIVARGGGHVELESEVGRGTTLCLHLPRTAALCAAPPPKKPVPSSPGATVLVVEDEVLVRRTLRHYLEQSGYHVLEAADGAEALAASAAHDGPLKMLLTDVALPGMDGPTVARELTARRPGLRVLYVSAYPVADLLRQGTLPKGAVALRKPFDEDTLIAGVRRALQPRPSDPAPAATVLVVEDDEMSRRALGLFLEARGSMALLAWSGSEALKICAEHPDPIDVVLADLGLCDCTGDRLVEIIRAGRPDIGVLYMSGRERTDSLVKRALEGQERTLFLRKPFELEDLTRSLGELMSE